MLFRSGHQAGDRILQEVANWLVKNFNETDLVGRIGGDEFMVFWKTNVLEIGIEHKAKELLDQLQFWTENILVSVSIGVCLTKGNKKNFEELYGQADAALYNVKRHGKGKFAIWGDE